MILSKYEKEEYAITQDRDGLILLDRKVSRKKYATKGVIDDFFDWFDQNAPLHLRVMVRKSKNAKRFNTRKKSKNKKG